MTEGRSLMTVTRTIEALTSAWKGCYHWRRCKPPLDYVDLQPIASPFVLTTGA